jgi:hypothetical protein
VQNASPCRQQAYCACNGPSGCSPPARKGPQDPLLRAWNRRFDPLRERPRSGPHHLRKDLPACPAASHVASRFTTCDAYTSRSPPADKARKARS